MAGMTPFYFSFGQGTFCLCGRPMVGKFVSLEAESEEKAVEKLSTIWSRVWMSVHTSNPELFEEPEEQVPLEFKPGVCQCGNESLGPKVHWFGQSWGAPICSPKLRMEIPNDVCDKCKRHLGVVSRGVSLAASGLEKPRVNYHLPCFMSMVLP